MKKMWIAFLLALCLILPPAPALAGKPNDGEVIFGEDFILRPGEKLDGDLVVFGGDVTLEKGSFVDGSILIIGGDAEVAGEVDGDIVVLGGNLELKSRAVIDGDAVAFGGRLDVEEGAIVRGELVKGLGGIPIPRPPLPPIVPEVPRRPTWVVIGSLKGALEAAFGAFFGILKALFASLTLTALGLLVVLFLPQQTEQVGDVILAYPLLSLGVGFLTAIIAFGLGLLLLPICLVGSLVWVLALIAGLFGWIAVGLLVGQKLLAVLQIEEPGLPVATIVGVLLISLVAWAPCCLGFLFALGVGSTGLGAVVLTRFGTVDYPPPASPPPSTPTIPPVATTESEEALPRPEAGQEA